MRGVVLAAVGPHQGQDHQQDEQLDGELRVVDVGGVTGGRDDADHRDPGDQLRQCPVHHRRPDPPVAQAQLGEVAAEQAGQADEVAEEQDAQYDVHAPMMADVSRIAATGC